MSFLEFSDMDDFGEKHSHLGDNLKQHMKDVGIQGSQTDIDHGEDEGKPMPAKYEAKPQPNWQQERTDMPDLGMTSVSSLLSTLLQRGTIQIIRTRSVPPFPSPLIQSILNDLVKGKLRRISKRDEWGRIELHKKEQHSYSTTTRARNPQGGILISDESDRGKLYMVAQKCLCDHAYASSIRYLEIRDAGLHNLADDLLVLLKECENLDTIIFKSYKFDDSEILEFEQICRSITKFRNNIKYLEFSNMKDFGEEHAKILGKLIQDVKVETLNLNGSNLEQYLHDVFIVLMKQSSSVHRTNIVFGQDEVNCLVQPTGTVKEFGLSGCKITVPTNALAEPKQITLQVLASLVKGPGNLVQVSPVLRFLPSGLHFNKPITVQVPVWCVFKGHSINLKVFKRFDENAEWKEECVVKYTGGKFIQYETNHFCEDFVCADAEEECQYQLMVYNPKYRRMNDSYELHIYCKPSNQDIANEVHREAQSCELQMYFPPLKFKLPATGHIEVKVEQEDPLLDCNVVEGRKVFECANLGNYHTTYIRCDLSDDTKRRGIGLKFTAMVNQRSEVKLIKAIWKEPPPGDRVVVVQNLYSVNTTCSVDEINVVARKIGQLNIASYLERIRNVLRFVLI